MKTVKSIMFNALLATIPFLLICGLPLTALKVCAETYEIEVNTEVSGNEAGCYRFTVDKPGYITVTIKGEPCTTLTVEFSREQGGMESKGTYWRNDSEEFTFLGNYINAGEVGIISIKGPKCSYTFTVNYTECTDAMESEDNDSIEYADQVEPGTEYKAGLGKEDVDWYSFSVTEDGYVDLDCVLPYFSTVHLYKEGADSEILMPKTGGYNHVYVEPGTYYFMVENYYPELGPNELHTGAAWALETMRNRSGKYRFCVDFTPVSGITWRAMYRLYNPNSGEHFWTGSTEERDNLAAEGWNYEGHGWNAPVEEGEPVYRFYNATLGDHHYTKDPEEIAYLNAADGWTCEDVCWNSASAETGVPLYRLYNPNAYADGTAGAHHYTMSDTERAHLIYAGWIDEGIGWYAERE